MNAKKASQTSVCRATLLSLITACSFINTSLAIQLSWLFESPFDSSNCINTVSIVQASTKLQCATLCGQSNGCDGFFYKKDTLSCLHIDPSSSSDCMFNNALQWTSWKKRTAIQYTEQTTSPTTTTVQTTTPSITTEQTTTTTTTTEQTYTPITTMAQPTCPITLPMDTYTSTTLSDNTQFTFLFVQNEGNQSYALSRCPNYNGTLVQIITAPKMDFLMDCLNKTFEGYDYNFWIDANKLDGLWKTSDGKAVLSDGNYWQSGLTSGTKGCANLSGIQYNYKMSHNVCSNSDQRLFICENTN